MSTKKQDAVLTLKKNDPNIGIRETARITDVSVNYVRRIFIKAGHAYEPSAASIERKIFQLKRLCPLCNKEICKRGVDICRDCSAIGMQCGECNKWTIISRLKYNSRNKQGYNLFFCTPECLLAYKVRHMRSIGKLRRTKYKMVLLNASFATEK